VRYQCSASWAVAVGRFPIFYLSKSHSDSRRARRFFEALIIVPAVYLALQQHPAARSIALMSLGRKRGSTLARAMEGDRDIRRHNAPKGSRYSGPVRLKRINRPNRLAAQPSLELARCRSATLVRAIFAMAARASTNRAITVASTASEPRSAVVEGQSSYPDGLDGGPANSMGGESTRHAQSNRAGRQGITRSWRFMWAGSYRLLTEPASHPISDISLSDAIVNQSYSSELMGGLSIVPEYSRISETL